MLNIAICDDDMALTSYIEELLHNLGEELGITIHCDIFFDGSTLVENILRGTGYDLIYLDIEMPKVNGISAAEQIRNREFPALIVYVSSYEKYLKELFNTEPFRFLSKPIDGNKFRSVFMDANKRIRQKSEYFSFSYNKEYIKIPLGKIYYFESRNRVIYIHTARTVRCENTETGEAEYRFYGKMNDVEKQLSDSNARFLRIHQSYLVNFDYIKSMNFTSVTMSDGTVLQISEDRQKNVRARFCAMAKMEVPGNE